MDIQFHTSEHITIFVKMCIFEVQYYAIQIYIINWTDPVIFTISFPILGHNALQHWQEERANGQMIHYIVPFPTGMLCITINFTVGVCILLSNHKIKPSFATIDKCVY
jgi:hypothetical protein